MSPSVTSGAGQAGSLQEHLGRCACSPQCPEVPSSSRRLQNLCASPDSHKCPSWSRRSWHRLESRPERGCGVTAGLSGAGTPGSPQTPPAPRVPAAAPGLCPSPCHRPLGCQGCVSLPGTGPCAVPAPQSPGGAVGVSPGRRRSAGNCARPGGCGTAGTAPGHPRPPPARSQPIRRCQGQGWPCSPSGTPQDPPCPPPCPPLPTVSPSPAGPGVPRGRDGDPPLPGGFCPLPSPVPAGSGLLRGSRQAPRGPWPCFASSPLSRGGAPSLQKERWAPALSRERPARRGTKEGASRSPGSSPSCASRGRSPTSPRAPGGTANPPSSPEPACPPWGG